jgi:hypothetical protein
MIFFEPEYMDTDMPMFAMSDDYADEGASRGQVVSAL